MAKATSQNEPVEATPETPVLNTVVNHSESPASANVKLFSARGADIMLTVRSGCTIEEAKSVLDVLAETIKYGVEKYHLDTDKSIMYEGKSVAASATPAQQTSAPAPASATAAPPAPSGASAPAPQTLSFNTDCMERHVSGNTVYWKVKGGPYAKHGVTIWPEVLGEVFELDGLVENVYDLKGYVAHYIEKEPGKPNKVVRLEKIA